MESAQKQAIEPSPAGHRERKKQRIKAQLTEAALTLFSTRGFEETTVEDIASAVDLVPRTFFRYFRSKDDALFGWYDIVRERMLAALLDRPRGEGAVSAVIATTRSVLDSHGAQERIVLITHRLRMTSPELHMRHAATRSDLQHEAAQLLASRLAPQPSAALVAEMVTALVFAASTYAVDLWAADGATRPLLEYAEPIFAQELTLFREVNEQYTLR